MILKGGAEQKLVYAAQQQYTSLGPGTPATPPMSPPLFPIPGYIADSDIGLDQVHLLALASCVGAARM